jgi:hypothetical protein
MVSALPVATTVIMSNPYMERTPFGMLTIDEARPRLGGGKSGRSARLQVRKISDTSTAA